MQIIKKFQKLPIYYIRTLILFFFFMTQCLFFVNISVVEAAPIDLSVAANSLSVSDNPVIVGTVARWSNAGVVDGQNIDIKATVLSMGAGDSIVFEDPSTNTSADDFGLHLYSEGLNQPAEAEIKWEIVLTGTSMPVFADVNLIVSDLDGIGGNPDTRETILSSLNFLTSYGHETPTNIVFNIANGYLSASGTQNQSAERVSAASFLWNSTSNWQIKYKLIANGSNSGARFIHDGDGDMVFANKTTVKLLDLDLDADNSTQTGEGYKNTFVSNGNGVNVVDTDVDIVQNSAIGTNIAEAIIKITNTKSGDELYVDGTLPNGISFTTSTVAGKFQAKLSGIASETDYETALKLIRYRNTLQNPDIVDRKIDINVRNSDFQTNSNVAISTISIVVDTDGDGVADILDLDDDNDGIPDCQDNLLSNDFDENFYLSNSATKISANEVQLTPESQNLVGQVFSRTKADFSKSFDFSIQANLGNIDNTGADGIAILFHNDPQGFQATGGSGYGMGAGNIQNGIVMELDTYSNGAGFNDIGNDHTSIWDSDDQINGEISSAIDFGNLEDGVWHDIHFNWDVSTHTISYTVDNINAGSYTGDVVNNYLGGKQLAYFGFTASTGGYYNDQRIKINDFCSLGFVSDSDGDGIPNSRDLDSDNDGIPDVIEAGGSDSDGDGIIGTGSVVDTDRDGLSNIVDTDNGGTSLANQDADGDGVKNMVDIDSDGDGIVDNIEGQTTAGYTAPSGTDTDGDGLDNVYDTNNGGIAVIPTNTDGTDNPDYLDTDSDNDGDSDALEGWDTDNDGTADTVPVGADADNDGLDDAYDADDTQINPTNGQTPSSFPDLDNSGNDRDWRQGPNTNPVANDDSTTTNEDATLVVSATNGLLANDTDADTDTLTVTSFTDGTTTKNAGETLHLTEGDLTINADGSYTFVPASSYYGSVPQITYTVSDGNGGADSATLDIAVNQRIASGRSGVIYGSGPNHKTIYSCKDTRATNFSNVGVHKESLCKYKNENIVKEKNTEKKVGEKCELVQKTCPIFTQHMKLGDRDGQKAFHKQEKGVSNIINEVELLQYHLKKQGFYNGSLNGYYSKAVFDAVSKWQEKYKKNVLEPWGFTKPTGYFYKSSERNMNIILGCNDEVVLDTGKVLPKVSILNVLDYAKDGIEVCKEKREDQKKCPIFTQHMKLGDRDGQKAFHKQEKGVSNTISEVSLLQEYLKKQGFYNGTLDGYYSKSVFDAVLKWQLKYKKNVLDPWNLKKPTGYFYKSSERWMNELFGCDDQVLLDNGVLLK